MNKTTNQNLKSIAVAAPQLLREETLAIRMGMSEAQLSRLRKRGLAPPHISISTGKRSIIRYSIQSVNDWIAARDSKCVEVVA